MIAIVDDDEGVCQSLERALSASGFMTQAFGSADEFLLSGIQDSASCLILDVRMPDKNGFDLQAILRSEGQNLPIIFITGFIDEEVRSLARNGDAIAILEKPFDINILIDKINAALIRSTTDAAAHAESH